MNRRNLLAAAMLVVSTTAFAQTYVYKGEVELRTVVSDPLTSTPGGIDIAPNGDIYVATFEAAQSGVLKLPNAVSAIEGLTSPSVDLLAKESQYGNAVAIEAGRGYNDIELDGAGNIYVAGTGAGNATSILRKLDSTGASLWLFPADARVQGVAVGTTTVLTTVFGNLRTYDAATGALVGAQSAGGTTFQRSLALNPANFEVYAGRNGNNNNDTLNVWTGGHVGDATNYVQAKANAIADIGVGSAFGVATQGVDFDANNTQLVAADMSDLNDTTVGAKIYDVTGSGAGTVFTQNQALVPPVHPGSGNLLTGVNGIAQARIGLDDYLAIAGNRLTQGVVILYKRQVTTSVNDWQMFE